MFGRSRGVSILNILNLDHLTQGVLCEERAWVQDVDALGSCGRPFERMPSAPGLTRQSGEAGLMLLERWSWPHGPHGCIFHWGPGCVQRKNVVQLTFDLFRVCQGCNFVNN